MSSPTLSPPRRDVWQPSVRRSLVIFLTVAALIALPALPALALNPFEFEVYPYATEGPGVVELEWLQSFVPKGHAAADQDTAASNHIYRSSFELTYGLTDRIEAAAYLDLGKPSGDSVSYAGSRYRLRGRLFEQGELPVDLGWYAELEWRKRPRFGDQDLEADLRPIIERDFGRFSLELNPIFEKALVGPGQNKGFEFSYAAKLAWRWRERLSPGVEFYGDIGHIDDSDPLTRQQHYVFPVVDLRLPHNLALNLGVGVGLTRGSDQVITKVNLELEHFVGALFE
jgi:hypothetical protein